MLKNRLSRMQSKIVPAIVTALKENRKCLVTMATGTGKTITAAKAMLVLQQTNPKATFLWLTHKNELIDQTERALSGFFKPETIGFYSAREKSLGRAVTIASIPTLSRKNHLDKVSKEKFDYLIVDEAHHAPAETWGSVISAFSKARILGLTATPVRPDGELLSPYFGDFLTSCSISFRDAVSKDLLSKPDSRVILTDSNLDPIYTEMGDFSPKALERLVASQDRDTIVIRAYKDYARPIMKKNKLKFKAICFCVNTQHAERLAGKFTANGVPARYLSGSSVFMSSTERTKTDSTFRKSHDIEVLCVVDLYNEGIDIPDVGCLLMARPTRSNIIYSQQLGRGARRMEGEKKHNFAVLDFVDVTRKGFSTYVCSTATKYPCKPSHIVTHYVKVQDEIRINERVEDVLKSAEDFEFSYRKTWTDEELIAEAQKYTTSKQWREASGSTYDYSSKRGILPLCTEHMKKPRTITNEMLKEDALHYKTRGEWQSGSTNFYFYAQKRGLLDLCCKHMTSVYRARGYWTLDNCLKVARKVCNEKQLQTKYPGAAGAARSKGWLPQIKAAFKKKKKESA